MIANQREDNGGPSPTFTYGNLALWRETSAQGQRLGISLMLTNTGKRAGSELMQVYLRLPEATNISSQRLVGVNRIFVPAGAAERVQFILDPLATSHPFSYWNTQLHQWEVAIGKYHISLGTSATDIRLTRPFFWGIREI
jgi:beta-glucosidase